MPSNKVSDILTAKIDVDPMHFGQPLSDDEWLQLLLARADDIRRNSDSLIFLRLDHFEFLMGSL